MTKEEAMLIHTMRNKSLDIRQMAKHFPILDTAAIEYTCSMIKSEVQGYSKRRDSTMVASSAKDMESFSLQVGLIHIISF